MSERSGLVVDTSAAFAILTNEPGGDVLVHAIEASATPSMSTVTLVELGIVIEARFGPSAAGIAQRFVADAVVEVVSVDRALADRALEGWRRFGKGRHRAGLNLGDCFTYGLADLTGHPVLCIGDDFAATDVAVVRPSLT